MRKQVYTQQDKSKLENHHIFRIKSGKQTADELQNPNVFLISCILIIDSSFV